MHIHMHIIHVLYKYIYLTWARPPARPAARARLPGVGRWGWGGAEIQYFQDPEFLKWLEIQYFQDPGFLKWLEIQCFQDPEFLK